MPAARTTPQPMNASLLPVRQPRNSSHIDAAQISGTMIGSMPMRLKWMCQRMTASMAAASSGKVAERLLTGQESRRRSSVASR